MNRSLLQRNASACCPISCRFQYNYRIHVNIMNENRLREILAKISDVHIAVVGDFFLDRYWKIAPELDEPSIETGLMAYQIVERWGGPGAAGTITNNLAALGVGKIHAVGFLGKDGEGNELAGHLDAIGAARTYMIETRLRATPCYTKPMRNGIEMNRFDIKNHTETPKEVEDELISSIHMVACHVKAIIIMDQVSEDNCGVLTDRVRNALIQLSCKNSSLLVYADSRKRIGLYNEMIVKCNEREILEVFGLYDGRSPKFETVKQCGYKLADKTKHPVFITLGERGQLVVYPRRSRKKIIHVPALRVKDEIDICGVGDASSSAIIASLCSGATHKEAVLIGNLAASVTIRKIGQTGTASQKEILSAYEEYAKQNNTHKQPILE